MEFIAEAKAQMPEQSDGQGPPEIYKEAMEKALQRFHRDKSLAEIKRRFSDEKVSKKTVLPNTREKRNKDKVSIDQTRVLI